MSSSKLFTTFLLVSLTLPLFLQTSFGANPLYHVCSNSETFTANSFFETQLKILIMKLINKSYSTGFGVGSMSHLDQKTYGLFLCRGDVSASDCKACVSDATNEIRSRCPYNKGATIWYDYCMFKYLDTDFTGHVDNTIRIYMWNVNSVSDPATFNSKTRDLLSQLAQNTYDQNNRKLYAAGEVRLDNSVTLHGLTQCTQDLSSSDCKACLDDALDRLPSCCDGKQGGRVIGGSCNFRYEIYPFLHQ